MRNAWSWPPTHLVVGSHAFMELLSIVVVVAVTVKERCLMQFNKLHAKHRFQIEFCDAFAEFMQCPASAKAVSFHSWSASENWCRKSCTFNIMIPLRTVYESQDYPLQCKPCFHIKTHLNTCFDHICHEFTNWRACAINIWYQ